MTLSPLTVDRLFDRLAAAYGREWFSLWEGVDAAAVKASWAHELGEFETERGLLMIKWALDNLPARCPNAMQFKALCRQAHLPPQKQLPSPPADPERVKAAVQQMRQLMQPQGVAGDRLAWARRVMARYHRCERLSPTVIAMAREALKREQLTPQEGGEP